MFGFFIISGLKTSVRIKFKVEKKHFELHLVRYTDELTKELMEEVLKPQFLSTVTPNKKFAEKAGSVMSLLGSLAEQSSSEAMSEQFQILLFSFRPILNMFRGLTSTCFESGGSIVAWKLLHIEFGIS